MRDIKFRAWDGIRMTTTMIQFDNGSGILSAKGRGVGGSHDTELPIMQYTGLKDKNGVDIYEGDIVKGNHRDNWYIVNYCGGLHMLNCCYPHTHINQLVSSPTCDPQSASWLEESEVIGNIHENPELLESVQRD